MRRNYIKRCEDGASMAMQPKAWMTGYLFFSWISHFKEALEKLGGILPSNRHLLILDGHSSHVTLDVIHKAKLIGLDILTLPSHTSHRLQPLDVSVFRLFKCAFRTYRDAWTLRHKGKPAMKEDLAHWVSLVLRKALSPENIKKGFEATGIWPFNSQAMDLKMGPSKEFNGPVLFPGVHDAGDDNKNSSFYDLQDSDQESTDCEAEVYAQ
jgi:hypothetical protein